jgi:hypothetical protein
VLLLGAVPITDEPGVLDIVIFVNIGWIYIISMYILTPPKLILITTKWTQVFRLLMEQIVLAFLAMTRKNLENPAENETLKNTKPRKQQTTFAHETRVFFSFFHEISFTLLLQCLSGIMGNTGNSIVSRSYFARFGCSQNKLPNWLLFNTPYKSRYHRHQTNKQTKITPNKSANHSFTQKRHKGRRRYPRHVVAVLPSFGFSYEQLLLSVSLFFLLETPL